MVGILTYNVPHRKTYDTLCLLKAKGFREIAVFAEPLHYDKKFKPLLLHRPQINNHLTPNELCKNLNYQYNEGFDKNILPTNSIILVCGAGIIPQVLIKKFRIINSHPGYIPYVRGLDALKWAIYDKQPIGVTTHQLGDHIDAGLIIDRKLVPLHSNDTFHAVAQRQYEMEVNMLVDALDKIESAIGFIEPQDYPVKKRMPHEKETSIIERFAEIIQQLPV